MPSSRSRSRRRSALALYLGALLVVFVALCEGVLRRRGLGPWRPEEVAIRVEPGGTFYARDETLGYTHLPGRFRVTLADGYAFTVTHGSDTLRLTRPASEPAPTGERPQIWLFGGSYTHGWTVDDEDSYPWLLQAALPDHEVVNFGVGGYGTLHSLIQLREALAERESPVAAVIGYVSFHDVRNTFVRIRRKEFAPWNKLGELFQPYARLDGGGRLVVSMAPVEYRPFPLMDRSALVHALEIVYDRFENRRRRSRAVSEAIVEEFAQAARDAGAVPTVVGLDMDPATFGFLESCRARGIESRNLRVNLAAPGYRNHPHDLHPSAAAHRQYARRLQHFLEQSVLAPGTGR